MANKNIAVIPARRNSQGFRFKNRILFNETIDFLNKIKWFDEKIISTDSLLITLDSYQGQKYCIEDNSLLRFS